jgi:hypothetical protein
MSCCMPDQNKCLCYEKEGHQMSESKPREFWIRLKDNVPTQIEKEPPKYADSYYGKGVSFIQLVDKSAYDKAVSALKVADALIMNGYPDGGMQQAEWIKHRSEFKELGELK